MIILSETVLIMMNISIISWIIRINLNLKDSCIMIYDLWCYIIFNVLYVLAYHILSVPCQSRVVGDVDPYR